MKVYSDLADRCGVPQLAKKLNQVISAGIAVELNFFDMMDTKARLRQIHIFWLTFIPCLS